MQDRKFRATACLVVRGIILGVLVFLLANPTVGYGEEYRYVLEAGEFEIVESGEDFQQINMEGFGQILQPGWPKLPSKIFHIAIPQGMKIEEVQTNPLEVLEMEGVYNIVPAAMVNAVNAPPEKIKMDLVEYQQIVNQAYSTNAQYPAETGSFAQKGGYRKYDLVQVRFSPFQYQPQSGVLSLCLELEVIITYSPSQEIQAEAALMNEQFLPEVEERAEGLIENYQDAQEWYDAGLSMLEGTLSASGFVIITTEALRDAVDPLVRWETCKGRNVYVRTVEWLDTNSWGVDRAEKIRNWLRNSLASLSITKVCLIGDIADVPFRYTHPNGPDGPDDNSTPWQQGDKVPTDIYYAELTGTDSTSWNSNGDSMYGQRGVDNVQFPTEVDVGRIPWGDPYIVENICRKSAEFEYSTEMNNYKLNYLMTGAYFWSDTDNAEVKTYIINEELDPGNPPDRIYEQGPCWNSPKYSEYNMTRTITRSVWGGGKYGFVNLAGHGSKYGVYFQERHPTCSAEKYFYSLDDCAYLNDDYPSVVFSNACSTAYPEVNNLGRRLLERGAVAFVGSTRIAFGTHGWDEVSDGRCSSVDYLFCKRAISLSGTRSSVGWAHQRAMRDMYNLYGFDTSWWQMFEWNLYGNPDLWIKDRPTNLPNLTDTTPSGWSYPIVPRSSSGATSGWCPITATLPGNTDNAYYNWAWINNGDSKTPVNMMKVYLDGEQFFSTSQWLNVDQVANRLNQQSYKTVTGGRHTIYYELDVDEEVWETSESDNCWGHQFVWSPKGLGDDIPVTRSAPPKKDGWGCAPAPHYYNNDGFSFVVQSEHPDKWMSVVGMLPSSSSANYDLRLWDRNDYTGSEQGFGANYLEWSQETSGKTDFILVNDNKVPAGTYYAGVINANAHTAGYRIEEDTSTKVYKGTNGPYYRASHNVLDIYEIHISSAGDYIFKLEQLSGDCDLGMSLYNQDTTYCKKSEYMANANANGDGEDESFTVTVPLSGFYGLVVWKVDASDYSKSGSYQIKIGECINPSVPSNPTPVDTAKNVSINTDLDWDDCTDVDHYEVWMAKYGFKLIKLGETDVSEWNLDPLDYDTTYQWRVRAFNICGEYTTSRYWTFTTTAAIVPRITVTSPNGGEVWYIGNNYNIRWASKNHTGNVKIQVSTNGGLLWSTITNSTADDGIYSWTASAKAPSSRCLIKVSSVADPSVNDRSNRYFTLAESHITVERPNGGEIWYVGDTEEITWTSGGADKYVKIEFRIEDGIWRTIEDSVINSGSYLWDIASKASKECLVRISDSSLSDESDSFFAILNRNITIKTPNGGEVWFIGDTKKIVWSSSYITGNVKIDISRNNGLSWSVIAANTDNDGIHEWHVISPTSTSCRVRVSSLSYPHISDRSNTAFSIGYELKADADGSYNVDIDDFWMFLGNWLYSEDRPCDIIGDFNEDCMVDLEDFAILSSEWMLSSF